MNIKIPPEMEEEVLKHAEILGKTPEKTVLDFLWTRFSPPVKHKDTKPLTKPKEGQTLYDALRDHIGVIDSGETVEGGARMSEFASMKFTDGIIALDEHLRKNRKNKK